MTEAPYCFICLKASKPRWLISYGHFLALVSLLSPSCGFRLSTSRLITLSASQTAGKLNLDVFDTGVRYIYFYIYIYSFSSDLSELKIITSDNISLGVPFGGEHGESKSHIFTYLVTFFTKSIHERHGWVLQQVQIANYCARVGFTEC